MKSKLYLIWSYGTISSSLGIKFTDKKKELLWAIALRPLAIVFLDQLGQRMLQSHSAELKLESCDCYVDDCLMVWTHGETNLIKFVDHCNKQQATSKHSVHVGEYSTRAASKLHKFED